MGSITLSSSPVSQPAVKSSHLRSLLAGVALASFSALLLELSLTRLFSVVLFYHFAFLAISIALLGLGAGGVLAYLAKNWLWRFQTRSLLGIVSTVDAVVVLLVLEVVLHVPVSLELTTGNFWRLTAIYLASAVPFFFTGLEFAVLYAREAAEVSNLYGADLAGGALACLAVVPILNWLGGPNAVLFSGMTAALAATVWTQAGRLRRCSTAVGILLLIIIAANFSGKWIDIVYAKGERRDASWVEFARWNAISRVEVDRQNDAKAIVIDADASTYIMNVDLQHWKGSVYERNLMSAPAGVVNILRPHGEYAIIGPGGGVDVVRAIANGSPSVTGIEINPLIATDIMRGRYADYAYHLYQRPDVHIHVSDGRSFIRSANQHFDVVQMTLVDTWASTAAGAFALSENNLYTVEAFQEYFQHLKPDGVLAITRWEFQQPREALRVVSLAMEALHRLGVSDPEGNFIVVSQAPLDSDGLPVAVLAKKGAFTAAEQEKVAADLQARPPLTALYLPSAHNENAFSALIRSNDPYSFARRYAYNVAPVSDNAPFFFFTLKLNQLLRRGSEQEGIDWKVNLGIAVLMTVLVISVLAVFAFLIVPLAVHGGNTQAIPRLLYFVAIGLGYILVEISFIQRFVLFLGHPTYALTVVVFLMLLSSGMGSWSSRRGGVSLNLGRLALLTTLGCLGLDIFMLPPILKGLVGLPFPAKLLISAGLIVPLGFCMGMPFPTGLRALARMSDADISAANSNSIEWAWAMNAGASVLGSVLAMVIAIDFGLNVTLGVAAAAYFSGLLLIPMLFP